MHTLYNRLILIRLTVDAKFICSNLENIVIQSVYMIKKNALCQSDGKIKIDINCHFKYIISLKVLWLIDFIWFLIYGMRSDWFLGEFDQKVGLIKYGIVGEIHNPTTKKLRSQLSIDIFKKNQIGGDCNRQ